MTVKECKSVNGCKIKIYENIKKSSKHIYVIMSHKSKVKFHVL